MPCQRLLSPTDVSSIQLSPESELRHTLPSRTTAARYFPSEEAVTANQPSDDEPTSTSRHVLPPSELNQILPNCSTATIFLPLASIARSIQYFVSRPTKKALKLEPESEEIQMPPP